MFSSHRMPHEKDDAGVVVAVNVAAWSYFSESNVVDARTRWERT